MIQYFSSTTKYPLKWVLRIIVPLAIFNSLIFFVLVKYCAGVSIAYVSIILIWLITVGTYLFLAFSYLRVNYSESGLSYKYFPFHSKTHLISADSIKEIVVVKINWWKDFLGTGIRYGIKGKGYITPTKYAIKITQKDKSILYFSILEDCLREAPCKEIDL